MMVRDKLTKIIYLSQNPAAVADYMASVIKLGRNK